MTDNEFILLKQKIKLKKEESQKAKGVIEQIESSWQKRYNISTIEEAENKQNELKNSIEEKKKKLDILKNKLQETIPDDWK